MGVFVIRGFLLAFIMQLKTSKKLVVAWPSQTHICSACPSQPPSGTQWSRPVSSHKLISTVPPFSVYQARSHRSRRSSLGLGDLLLLDAAGSAGRGAGAHLLELVLLVFGGEDGSAVKLLVELDDLRVDGLELGLVEVVAGGGAEAVGAATRVGGVVVVVFELGEADSTPEIRM